jgi:hypothetical protein
MAASDVASHVASDVDGVDARLEQRLVVRVRDVDQAKVAFNRLPLGTPLAFCQRCLVLNTLMRALAATNEAWGMG